MRRFLFYNVGLASALGAVVGAAVVLMDWSNGLTFAVALVGGTIVATMSLRESLFEGFRRSDGKRRRHSRHA